MKLTKSKLKQLIRETIREQEAEQLELDLQDAGTWEFFDAFVKRHPKTANTPIGKFLEAYKTAWKNSFDLPPKQKQKMYQNVENFEKALDILILDELELLDLPALPPGWDSPLMKQSARSRLKQKEIFKDETNEI